MSTIRELLDELQALIDNAIESIEEASQPPESQIRRIKMVWEFELREQIALQIECRAIVGWRETGTFNQGITSAARVARGLPQFTSARLPDGHTSTTESRMSY